MSQLVYWEPIKISHALTIDRKGPTSGLAGDKNTSLWADPSLSPTNNLPSSKRVKVIPGTSNMSFNRTHQRDVT